MPKNRLKQRFYSFLFSLLGASVTVYSQDGNKDFFVSANGHFGYVIAHHGSMKYLVTGHTPGFELAYTRPTHGAKTWQRAWHYPEYGVSFYYIYLSNPRQLGSGLAIHPFINLWLKRGERFNMKLKLTLAPAPGYLTRKFDRITNHKNNAIGTHWNGFDQVRFISTVKLSSALRMEYGLGLSHFSNGAITMPNLGINIPTFSMGFSWHANNKNIVLVPDTVSPLPKSTSLVFYGLAGITQIDPPGQKKRYGAFTGSANLERRISHKSKWTGGLELAYNSSYIAEYNTDTVFYASNAENIQLSIRGGYGICIGDLSFPIEMGVYLYNKQPSNGPIYHRIGMRYQLNRNWIANITLKTHWAKADYFEWGMGYSVPLKKKDRTK